MLGDLVASADPDLVVAQDVIDETGKRGGARRLAGETAMQSDGHHLRRLLALAVERVEIVAQRDEEILPDDYAVQNLQLPQLRLHLPRPCVHPERHRELFMDPILRYRALVHLL